MSFIGLQENYNRIRSLIQMAKSDGFVNIAELTYIIFVAQKLGLTKGELDELAKEEGNFSAPFSLADKKSMLFDIIKVMYVDGVIAESELTQCEDLALHMNIDKKAIGALLTHISSNANKLMDKDTFEKLIA